jgi:hypothetical protein
MPGLDRYLFGLENAKDITALPTVKLDMAH